MDWVLIGLLAILLVIFTLRAGTRSAVAVSLTFPVLAFALGALPSTAFVAAAIGKPASPLVPLIIAAILFVALFILVSRVLGSGFSGSALPLAALLTGLATAVVAVVFLNQILGSNAIWHFGPQIRAIFGPAYELFWILGSYAVLAFARR